MGIRSLSSASISTGAKRSKFWDGTASLLTYGFEHINSYTVTVNDTSIVNATSIPQTYSHLRIIANTRSTYNSSSVGGSAWKLQLGSGGTINTSSNYSTGRYQGQANSTVNYSWSGLVDNFVAEATWSNVNNYGGLLYITTIFDIINYTSTSNIKTIRYYQGFNANSTSGNCYARYYYGTLNSSSAVDSLRFDSSTPFADGGFATGTKFEIYGIK